MRLAFSIVAVGVALSLPLAARQSVPGTNRLNDSDVKTLIKQVRDNADRFESELDDKLKHETLRGPSGEIDVEKYLNDFGDKLENLDNRFKPEYAASTEALDVLRHATPIETYFRTRPAGTKGESEWNRLSDNLKNLAGAYGTSFPLTPNATARRMNDKEVATAADDVSKRADQLKKALDTALKADKTVDAESRKTAVAEVDQFAKDAKSLKSRLSDQKPASAEAERLFTQSKRIQDLITTRGLTGPVASIWSDLVPGLDNVARAFGRPR